MQKQPKKVAIVIPYYKANLSKDEEISLKHLIKFLGKYDKFLILPNSIKNISFEIPKTSKIFFPNEYFISVKTYSKLLTTKSFYQNFLNYEYILIYQFDALVFSDQLMYWCNKNYDYIGAPLYNSWIGNLSYKKNFPASGGNGGLSLRRIKSFIKAINIAGSVSTRTSDNYSIKKLWFLLAVLMNKSHSTWLNSPPKDYPFNEDGFWSYEASKYYPGFKIAPFKEALRFSFEKKPRTSFKLNNNQLPFGCHAWAKYDRDFWKPFLLP